MTARILPVFIATLLLIAADTSRTTAQNTIPDLTLGPEASISVVNPLTNQEIILGGAKRGQNLFHSFSSFSVPELRTTLFNGQSSQNILVRITGNQVSNINGSLGVIGGSNLFFVNPSGINFGPNSRLLLSGSFVASTAKRLNFADGSFFGNDISQSFLSSSTPTSLTIEPSASQINLAGSGHNITQPGSIFLPNNGAGQSTTGLRLLSGENITFATNQINLSGGAISVPSGNINLLAINSGQVNLDNTGNVQEINASSFGNINLNRQALVDGSGIGNGNIRIEGRDITLNDGALVLISNFGTTPAGTITIKAEEALQVNGLSSFNNEISGRLIARGIVSQTFLGKGADIVLNANTITADQSTGIISSTFGLGKGGDLKITSQEFNILGGSPFGTELLGSLVLATNTDIGQAGTINVNTGRLRLAEGGFLTATVFGPGLGGNVIVTADSISIDGGISVRQGTFETFVPSTLGTTNIASGVGGNIIVTSKSLNITNGGRIDASTLASGDAGSIDINTGLLTVSGTSPNSLDPLNSSAISSSASRVGPFLNVVFDLSNSLSGSSGRVNINADSIVVDNGAQITVRHDGTGNAGNLSINSKKISLNNGGITAITSGGNGGNIDLLLELLLSNKGLISGSAQGDGTGGNLTINSDLIVSFNNSLFSANAELATGGNIFIETQGIFLDENSKITASSLLGAQFTGTIEVNSPNIDFTKATLDLAIRPEVERVTTSCNIGPGGAASEFTRPGAGGIASNSDSSGEISVATTSQTNLQTQQEYYLDPETGKPEIYPNVIGWEHNPDGTVAFTSDPTKAVQTKAFCSKAAKNTL